MENNPNNYNQVKKRHYTATDAFWFFLLVLVFIVIFIFIFQYSWNRSMPHIFGLKPINFVQALLVLIVARMLFPSCSGMSMGMY